jgi:hypothetical protein
MPTGFQCAYPPCQCYVDKQGEFCSSHCRRAQASGNVEMQCQCGHAVCAGRPEEDLDGSSPS